MRVNPSDGSAAVTASQSRPAVQKNRLESDTLTAEATEGLERALKEAPTVRADKVARAKALLDDPSYPSAAHLDKLASLLARELTRPD